MCAIMRACAVLCTNVRRMLRVFCTAYMACCILHCVCLPGSRKDSDQ